MRKIFIVFLLFFSFCSQSYAEQSVSLHSEKKSLLILRSDSAKIYKPTRLVIGQSNNFLIKAPAGATVELALSYVNEGLPVYHGITLNLGKDAKFVTGVVPSNGFITLSFSIPNNKDMANSEMYFDAVYWKKSDYSDIQKLQIISPSGLQTKLNKLILVMPTDDPNKPAFAPALPGGGSELIKATQSINSTNSNNTDYTETIPQYEQPVILQNLRAPELLQNN